MPQNEPSFTDASVSRSMIEDNLSILNNSFLFLLFQRHGIILIGVVTVLTSLLFLYNSSFTDTPEDQMLSDGHQMDVLQEQTSRLEGYSSIIDHKVACFH